MWDNGELLKLHFLCVELPVTAFLKIINVSGCVCIISIFKSYYQCYKYVLLLCLEIASESHVNISLDEKNYLKKVLSCHI